MVYKGYIDKDWGSNNMFGLNYFVSKYIYNKRIELN